MEFNEWIKHTLGVDLDPSDLSDEEFYELEDIYNGQFDVVQELEREVEANDR